MLNDLSDLHQEVLHCLVEEAAEVTKEVCKAFRFGIDDVCELLQDTPRQRLATEVGDLLAIVAIAIETRLLDPRSLDLARAAKRLRLRQFTTHIKKVI